MANDHETNTQEITPESYSALKTELEAEKAKSSELANAATQPLKERIAALEADLKARGEEAEDLKTAVTEKDKGFASLTQNFEAAVAAYRNQVLKANPLIPAELVLGNTIADIDHAVDKAAAIVTRIKGGLAQEQQTVTVPAGAPGRTPPDLSGLSPKEKIAQGIQAKRK